MTNIPITTLKGVGDALAAKLSRLGITCVNDILEHYPRRYEDRSCLRTVAEMVHGEFATFAANVIRGEVNRVRGKSIARLIVGDHTGQAVLVWFNQPYRATSWKPGSSVLVYGRASRFRNTLQIESPEIDSSEPSDSLNVARIVPIYPLTQGLGSRVLRKLIAAALTMPATDREIIPADIRQSYRLMERSAALREIHFPSDWNNMRQAKRRIVFEELFLLQCALSALRSIRIVDRRSVPHIPNGDLIRRLESKLPFQLTRDQESAFDQISQDMENARPMHRLLQGDVGSGKTAVALLALAKTVENGLQGALMAPTEILAEQHYQSCVSLLDELGIRTALLTGRVKGSARKELLRQLLEGQVDILVGTQALLQPDVAFRKLGLVITDEQHRFGVGQRATLQEKGEIPHALVMSATPIPRTMALTLYGDMDVSVIRELPPGRKPIVTAVRSGEIAREKVYKFLVAEVEAGRQGYVVCPLVEESDKTEAQSAVSVFHELTSTFLQGIRCGMLHGRMTPDEKESVMRDFVAGRIGVLISTTVIEVGVNVPNASVMIVEDADRFGLAQLHQLRGRVGRGAERSYCVLMHSEGTAVPERLQVLSQTADGFVIAEKDLLLRGPGQFLGYRQHGLPEMKIASLADDAEILEEARVAGISLMQDPERRLQMNVFLQDRFERFFNTTFAG